MNGTVEAVAAQLTLLNPNWKTDFNFDKDVTAVSVVEAADNGWKSDPKCGGAQLIWNPQKTALGTSGKYQVVHICSPAQSSVGE